MTNRAWIQELERPSEGFFAAFAARIQEQDGTLGAIQEALDTLVPRIDWAGYLPQMPHGLLGLAAALRLAPLLAGPDFQRLLAIQLQALACEGRAREGQGLRAVSKGSGHWPHVALALERHQSALAWGEIQGLARPEAGHFRSLLEGVRHDMANLGHKAVLIHLAEGLHGALGRPEAIGRLLLGVAAWEAAAEPVDQFWASRIRKRLPEGFRVPALHSGRDQAFLEAAAGTVCETGLVGLFDSLAGWLREGLGSGDLLVILSLAAADKLVDARRDLEGRTAWTFTYLALVAEALSEFPEAWAQAAALINFFPSDGPEERLRAAETAPVPDPGHALREAILDAEPALALGWAQRVEAPEALGILAQTVVQNDPGANHSAQVLAVAAVADLLPRLPRGVHRPLLAALAKSLANSQGSGDLGLRAARALQQKGPA